MRRILGTTRRSHVPDHPLLTLNFWGGPHPYLTTTQPSTPFSTPHTLTATNPVKHTIIQHLSTRLNTDAERLEPFHSNNAPWHVTATSLPPRLSIKLNPCDIEVRPVYSASLNRELIYSRHDPTLLLVYSDGSRWKLAGRNVATAWSSITAQCPLINDFP